MSSALPSAETEFGRRVAARLRDEHLIWLTTVATDGTPQPNPVWFYWDGESFLIYSLNEAARLEHIRRNPRVALHFDGNGHGGNIVIFTGDARISADDPPADQLDVYCEKYRDFIARSFGTPAEFAARYSVPVRIVPTRVRGH
jgi:PPOX class probable F420-dependent enzyme